MAGTDQYVSRAEPRQQQEQLIESETMIRQLCVVAVVLLVASVANVSEAGRGRKKASGSGQGQDCPQIKLKRQWGGKPALGLNYQVRPVRYVVIHHTVTASCSGLVQCADKLQGMQIYHQNELDYDDIGYK